MRRDVESSATAPVPVDPGRVAPHVRWRWVWGGLAAAMALGLLFALALRNAGDWNAGLSWEHAIMRRIDPRLPRPLDALFLIVPWIGTNWTLLPIVLVVAAWLRFRRHRGDLALHLLVVGLGSWTLNQVPKALFGRERPELWEHRGQFGQASFPSGHAIASITVLVTAAVLLHRERGWRWPIVTVVGIILITLYSRIYLGVHWPGDVVAGGVMGVVWLAATLRAFPPVPRAAVDRASQNRYRGTV
ncbi:MAG: phosphatase PAP2 family protein [Gemmatimonadaceae bacterium]